MNKELLEKENIIQFIKFGIVGASNTIVSYVIYLVCLFIFQQIGILQDIDYLVAQWIGFILSIFWAFILNKKFVFKEAKEIWYKSLIKSFLAYSVTGLLLSSILLYIEVDIFGISKIIAPIINVLICVPINYLINKKWAFMD